MLVAQMEDHQQQLAKREALIEELKKAVELGASQSKSAQDKLERKCRELAGSSNQITELKSKLEESKSQNSAL